MQRRQKRESLSYKSAAVLDMVRIESGKMELNEQSVNVKDAVDATEEMFRNDMEAKGISFHVVNQTKVKTITANGVRIKQIVTNLLSNALKFTAAGGSVTYLITDRPDYESGTVEYEIHIRDTGIGMTREFQKKRFTAFEREKTSTVSGVTDTGLGLAISYNLATMLGGTISCESVQGQGTDFTVIFSAAIAEEEPVSLQKFSETGEMAVCIAKSLYL